MLAPPVVEGKGSGQPSEPQPEPSTSQPRIEEQILVTESSSPQNTQSPRQALQEDTHLPTLLNGVLCFTNCIASAGAEGPIPPKTAEQKLARKNELKAKSTLLLAIPNEHLLKFHACKDAKSL
ncbi:hypothetical protein Tco_0782975 [Tanacetum coccineum]